MKKHLLTDQFELADIKKVFAGLEASAANFLLKVAKTKYGLRGAVILFINSRNNNDTTEKGLRAMAKTMEIAI